MMEHRKINKILEEIASLLFLETDNQLEIRIEIIPLFLQNTNIRQTFIVSKAFLYKYKNQ